MAWQDITEPRDLSKKLKDEVVRAVRKKKRASFLLDHNVPAGIADVITSLGARIETAAHLGLEHCNDVRLLAEAQKREAVLITLDRDFLDKRKFPTMKLVACVVVLDLGSGSFEEVWSALAAIRYIQVCPQFFDKWCRIDAHPREWVEEMRCLDGSTFRSRMRMTAHGRVQEWV